MCLYVGSEVVLANLLSKKDEITIEDISLYCEKLKKRLSNKNLYININDEEINNMLLKYPDEFRYFQDRYFANDKINLNYFNSRYSRDIASTFAAVAQTV